MATSAIAPAVTTATPPPTVVDPAIAPTVITDDVGEPVAAVRWETQMIFLVDLIITTNMGNCLRFELPFSVLIAYVMTYDHLASVLDDLVSTMTKQAEDLDIK
eukprot:gene10185-11231_t